MWGTRLLVLGLVRWLGPVHGYLVRREIDSWHMPGVSEVGAGSIYHALKKLASEGLIEVVATESVEDRPARTTYRITASGEREFQRLLREKLWNLQSADDPFHTAWAFASVLTPAENAAMLRQRAESLFSRIEAMTALLASTAGSPLEDRPESYTPPHARALLKRRIDLCLADAEWCEETAERIESGELDLDSEPDGRAAENWRLGIGSDRFEAELKQRREALG